jgi:DNA-binding transcriptional MerR regulator
MRFPVNWRGEIEMKANAVVTALGIADSTVRKYAEQYAEFLSPTGTGGAGRHRDYTDHDVRVLKLIVDMKAGKTSPDDIDVTLRSLQDGGWEQLPALDVGAQALVLSPQAQVMAQADKSAMQREIDVLREMLTNADERADARVAQVTADRDELLKRLHRAELKLELYESGELKPKG